jgi:hypothetical protein
MKEESVRALPPYPPHPGCELAHPMRVYAPISNKREWAQMSAMGALLRDSS